MADEHLARVTERISGAVQEFCGNHSQFRMVELAEFVGKRTGVAPDSPGRILRQLRSLGRVRYRVVDRRSSLYEILRPEPRQETSLLSNQQFQQQKLQMGGPSDGDTTSQTLFPTEPRNRTYLL
jgi:hypothetical protein